MTTTEERDQLLDRLLNPESIVVIGASDRNAYSQQTAAHLKTIGYRGRVHQVNLRGVPAHGRPAVRSCAEIGEPVDVAYVGVPAAAVLDAVRDALDAGIRRFVVLSSGFAELGPDGAELQEQLLAMIGDRDACLIGPNCLGFVNYVDDVVVGSLAPRLPQRPPAVAVISASGAVAHELSTFAQQHGIGLTHAFATGNEADIGTAELLSRLVDDARVKAIAIFLESVANPALFGEVALRALRQGKPIVVLKVGSAPATAAVVRAHTGVSVGDDAAFDRMCESYGIVRVRTFEDLMTTAALLGRLGPLAPRGIAVVSQSGGGCEVISDLATRTGVPLPPFAPDTQAEVREILAGFGQALNPLDVTGAAMRDRSIWTRTLRAVAADPGIGLVACNFELPTSQGTQLPETLAIIAEGLRDIPTPGLFVTTLARQVDPPGQDFLDEYGLSALPGMGIGMTALGNLAWWSAQVEKAAT